MKIKDKLTWINNKEWDSVVIAPIDSDKEYVIVNNQDILKSISDFLYINREVDEPNLGFISDVPRYLYTFISDHEQYDIAIVARGIVEINGHYYETNPYIHKLGDAFIKSEKWRLAGNIETKIANSGLIMTEFGPIYSKWRIQWIANEISKGKLVTEIPSTYRKDEASNYTSYYFGEEILMQVYSYYIYIKDGTAEYSYELENADYKIHDILNGIE